MQTSHCNFMMESFSRDPTSCDLAEIAEGGEDTLEGEAEPEKCCFY